MNSKEMDLEHIRNSLKVKLRKYNNSKQNNILIGEKGNI